MKHRMNLNPAPFAMIKSGEKTIELRLYDEKRQKINTDDIIIFTNTETAEQIEAVVDMLHVFESFDELYRTLPLLKCGYTKENVHAASPDDMSEYYSLDRQREYGVVGIEVSVISI